MHGMKLQEQWYFVWSERNRSTAPRLVSATSVEHAAEKAARYYKGDGTGVYHVIAATSVTVVTRKRRQEFDVHVEGWREIGNDDDDEDEEDDL